VATSSRPSPGTCRHQHIGQSAKHTSVACLRVIWQELALPERLDYGPAWQPAGLDVSPSYHCTLLYTPFSRASSSVLLPWNPPPTTSVTPRLRRQRHHPSAHFDSRAIPATRRALHIPVSKLGRLVWKSHIVIPAAHLIPRPRTPPRFGSFRVTARESGARKGTAWLAAMGSSDAPLFLHHQPGSALDP
jgi:hypothetical protein